MKICDSANGFINGTIDFDIRFSRAAVIDLDERIYGWIDDYHSITRIHDREKHEILTAKDFKSIFYKEMGEDGAVAIHDSDESYDLKEMVDSILERCLYGKYGRYLIIDLVVGFNKNVTQKLLRLNDEGKVTIPEDILNMENDEMKIFIPNNQSPLM